MAAPRVLTARPVRLEPARQRGRGPHLERVPVWSVRGILGLLIILLLGLVIVVEPLRQLVVFLRDGPQEPATEGLSAAFLWANVIFQVILFLLLPLAYVRLVRPGVDLWGHLRLRVTGATIVHVLIGFALAVGLLFLLGLIFLGLSEAGIFQEDPSPLVEELERIVLDHPEFLLIVPLAAGVAEEVLFRGVLQQRIGLLASSALFGLVHIGYGTVLQVVVPFVLGLVFGLFFRWFRTLWVPIAAHFAFNFIQLAILFVPEL